MNNIKILWTWTDLVWSGLLKAMILKHISEAKAELSALVEAVQRGEDVGIGKSGVPVARLIPFRRQTERLPGRLKGKFTSLLILTNSLMWIISSCKG